MPSTNSTTNNHGTGFLGNLEPSIKRFPYQGKRHFNKIMNQEFKRRLESTDRIEKWSEWVLFTDIDENTFTHNFPEDSEHKINDWTTSPASYDSSLCLLLARIALLPHEVASGRFRWLLISALMPMGLGRCIRHFGSAAVYGTGGVKQPDSSWAPRRTGGNLSKIPTVVLEVALSETESKLSSDVRFWLNQVHGDVKVVLTLDIDREGPGIVLEKWELRDGYPIRTARVGISMDADKRVRVDGPLVIEFEKLFFRPVGDAREGDIVTDTDMLEELVTEIWEIQEFVEVPEGC
ncbi:uncharacterized protein PGRI_028970 [Penicillium griseofulvum]|uniref:Uncharacterized protein n=1 Tax=Penicillium patulum TaxID=5078 RepID=A0A135LJ72_PENPA|nr:uncharacterized protein PGRI_028970 [Penicillium griseofulvum]KXG49027.1 hypothetical protein PGRI_028970 [Penicillium griseofulvum]